MHESTDIPGHICTIISATFVGSPPQKSLQPKGFNSTRPRLFTLLLPPSPNINTSDIYPFIHSLAALLTSSCETSISDSDQTKALFSLHPFPSLPISLRLKLGAAQLRQLQAWWPVRSLTWRLIQRDLHSSVCQSTKSLAQLL